MINVAIAVATKEETKQVAGGCPYAVFDSEVFFRDAKPVAALGGVAEVTICVGFEIVYGRLLFAAIAQIKFVANLISGGLAPRFLPKFEPTPNFSFDREGRLAFV